MSRYHIWADADFYGSTPQDNSAEFVGYAHTAHEVIPKCQEREAKLKDVSKSTYALMFDPESDKSPSPFLERLYENGWDYDEDDMVLEVIGNFTHSEAEKLMPEWKKEYAEDLDRGCTIDTVYSDDPETGILSSTISVYDSVDECWRGGWFGDACIKDEQRCRIQILSTENQHKEFANPLPINDFHYGLKP